MRWMWEAEARIVACAEKDTEIQSGYHVTSGERLPHQALNRKSEQSKTVFL